MDIFTAQSDIEIPLPREFQGLRVIARNSTLREVGYIWDPVKKVIILNIDLNAFPVSIQNANYCTLPAAKHVKIELEYEYPRADIDRYYRPWFGWIIDKFFSPKMESYKVFKDEIQPEFTITMPRGWKIRDNGKDLVAYFQWKHNGKKKNHQILLKKPPMAKLENGKLVYSYLLNPGLFNAPRTSDHIFSCRYRTELTWQVIMMSVIIPLTFTLGSLTLVLNQFRQSFPSTFTELFRIIFIGNFHLESTAYFAILTLYGAFFFTYLNYVREGYYLPKQHAYLILSMVITLTATMCGIIFNCSIK
jgi:hypothetical protein